MSNLPAGGEQPKSKRRWLQFSLRALFVLTLAVAGFFAGFRVGDQRGYQTGLRRRLSEEPVTRVYDVSDLVSVADAREYARATQPELIKPDKPVAPQKPRFLAPGEYPVPRSPGPMVDFDSLMDLITSTIRPNEWDTVGGPGSIAPHEKTLTLVVLATPFVHEEIESLFQKLREKAKAGTAIGLRGTSAAKRGEGATGHPEKEASEQDPR